MTKRTEFFTGLKDVLPILLGVAPTGMIYGASAIGASITPVMTQAMSSIVFAGAAQFVTVQLIAAAIPAGIIILTAGVLNLRHALYSASLAPYLKRLNLFWQLVLAYVLTDEAYALAIIHYRQDGESRHRHWYFLGAGVGLWATWQMCTALGILLGTHIPASWSLDFTLPLTFIALVIPALKQRADALAAVVAGVVALLAVRLPLNSGLLVATCIGIVTGMVMEARRRKRFIAHDIQKEETQP